MWTSACNICMILQQKTNFTHNNRYRQEVRQGNDDKEVKTMEAEGSREMRRMKGKEERSGEKCGCITSNNHLPLFFEIQCWHPWLPQTI